MKNIMILMPIDPMSIMEYGQDIIRTYDQQADIFSAQIFALLDTGTESENDIWEGSYPVQNILYTKTVANKPHLMLQKNTSYDVLLVYGNCDKSTTKWDHIITCEKWWNEDKKDPYIDASNEIFEKYPIDWLTYEDAEYSFPTWEHLKLFLKTLGVEANDRV